MNSSLPLITPRDSHTLWYTPSSTYSFAPAPQLPYSNNHNNNNNGSGSPLGPQNPSAQGQNQNTRSRTAGLSALQQLELDEQSVALRKLHIQRFGATWIRPPGMAKTYQGELDEKAEREEAEAHEMMEDVEIPGEGVFDVDEDGQALHANQDLDANIPDGGEISDLDNNIPEADSFVDGAEDEEEDDGEVDLDADIPEAEAETLWDDSDEEEELEEDSDDGDHTGYASAAHDVGNVSSTTADSGSFGGTDESPQQAAFSHDERFPNNRRAHSGQEYGWRGRARYRRSDDNMEVDSE